MVYFRQVLLLLKNVSVTALCVEEARARLSLLLPIQEVGSVRVTLSQRGIDDADSVNVLYFYECPSEMTAKGAIYANRRRRLDRAPKRCD